MKRLAIAIAAMAGTLVFAGQGQAALVNITVLDDEYDPPNASIGFPSASDNVEWDWGGFGNDTNNEHTVNQKKGLFKSGAPQTDGVFGITASAGKYPYFCKVHGRQVMKAKVSVLVELSEDTGDKFRATWATDNSETGTYYDVRYRVDQGQWETWKNHTSKLFGVFGRNDKPIAVDTAQHTYEISARSGKAKPARKKRSGYSPPVGTN